MHILLAEPLLPSFTRLLSPKLGNTPTKREFSRAFLSNRKEQIGLLSNFPANPLILELATGANKLKRETVRLITKNQDHQVENRSFICNRIVVTFRTPLHAYQMNHSMVKPSRIAIVCHINTTLLHRILSVSDIVMQTAPVVARRVTEERIQQAFPHDPITQAAPAVLDEPSPQALLSIVDPIN